MYLANWLPRRGWLILKINPNQIVQRPGSEQIVLAVSVAQATGFGNGPLTEPNMAALKLFMQQVTK